MKKTRTEYVIQQVPPVENILVSPDKKISILPKFHLLAQMASAEDISGEYTIQELYLYH